LPQKELNPAFAGFFYFCSPIIHSIKKITMGRGDKKTAKGKRFKGSFGKSRPARTNKAKRAAEAAKAAK
jgi:30S ribosomal protein S31